MFSRILLVCIGIIVAMIALEVVLRVRRSFITSREQLDGGLFQYDAALGWRLTPGWRGTHRHHDFTTEYAVSPRGFRNDPAEPPPSRRPTTLVLGDSFTFGLGVNDDQTFVHLLNADPAAASRWVNLAVPGYSTDQEILLLDQVAPFAEAERVVLVVYLGNDLIDNERAFPIQAPDGKPFFVLAAGGLDLRNVPVPKVKKGPGEPGFDLAAILLRADRPKVYRLVNRLNGWELGRPLAESLLRREDFSGRMDEAVAGSIQLFAALIRRAGDTCRLNGADLTVILLPGRSLIDDPFSLSARYQDQLRTAIRSLSFGDDVTVVDLTDVLRGSEELYYPHDGHLTPNGHRVVAEVLTRLW